MEWLDTVMKQNEAIVSKLSHQEVKEIAMSFKRRQAVIQDYLEHAENPAKPRTSNQQLKIDMTNHYVYAYAQAKELKTIIHQKLLLCKTAFDHKKISIDPASVDDDHLQLLMLELNIAEIPRT